MKKRKVLIIGAGKSGRGYIGELFDLENFQITYADNDELLVEALRAKDYYTVYKISKDNKVEKRIVKGYSVLSTVKDHKDYIENIINSEYVVTALYPSAFNQVADDLAEAIKIRAKRFIEKPMAILLGANYIGILDYYINKIIPQLTEEEKQYFKKYVALVECVILRASMTATGEGFKEDNEAIEGDDWNYLEVEQKQFKFPKTHKYPGFFIMGNNVQATMVKKIWGGNLRHCSLAFMGKYNNLRYIYEAANDSFISKCVYFAATEAHQALCKEYNIETTQSDEEIKGIWEYYRNASIKDSVLRVAASPVRKLSKNERFIGPALLCLKHNILPIFILKCAAYGFFYINDQDKEAMEMQEYIKENGIESAVIKYCGLDIKNDNDKIIYSMLVSEFNYLSKKNPVDIILKQ